MCFAYPDQVLPAVGTSMALEYNPKVWLGGPGVNFGFFHTTFGPATEGVLGWTTFDRDSSPELKVLADKLYNGKPEEISNWWGPPLFWAAIDMWKAATEKAGSLDQRKIRDILATDHVNTILVDTWFVNGLLAKETHPGEIGQWQNGVFKVIGPKDKAHTQFIYPKPPWPK
jgi:ABC-type branched-subunit amino acid transport system substrate-binding protein